MDKDPTVIAKVVEEVVAGIECTCEEDYNNCFYNMSLYGQVEEVSKKIAERLLKHPSTHPEVVK